MCKPVVGGVEAFVRHYPQRRAWHVEHEQADVLSGADSNLGIWTGGWKLDAASNSRGFRETPIQGDKRCVEGLGECDISRVVAGEVSPKLPNPLRKRLIRKQVHRQVDQVGMRLSGLVRTDQAAELVTSNDVRAFEGQ